MAVFGYGSATQRVGKSIPGKGIIQRQIAKSKPQHSVKPSPQRTAAMRLGTGKY